MKKYNKYLLMLCGAGLMTLSSCHLDEEPATAYSYDSRKPLITSVTELEHFTNALHGNFRSTFYGVMSQASEVMCDAFNASRGFGNNYGALHVGGTELTAENEEVTSFWGSYYGAIKDYNLYIQYADTFAVHNPNYKADVDLGLGYAHFYRAYSYLQLVRHFAKAYDASTAAKDLGVPVVTVYDQKAQPKRNTVKEVYAQIKKDLDFAAAKLVAVEGAVRSKVPTIDAVNALYARYYLDIKDYANAASCASKVINSAAGYALADAPESMLKEYRNDNGTEPIMQMAGAVLENGAGTNTLYTMWRNNASWGKAGYTPNGNFFQSYYLPTKKLVDAYGNSDLRRATWLTMDYMTFFSGSYYRMPNVFYTFVKYFGNMALTADAITPNARQLVKPFMIGEMYLIAAEANCQLGNTTDAETALNTLQEARGANATSATLANIKNEWFKETVGEGLRMSCLKRWGDGFAGRTPQATAKAMVMPQDYFLKKSMSATDTRWVWPIPAYERKVNPNLEQNPGY